MVISSYAGQVKRILSLAIMGFVPFTYGRPGPVDVCDFASLEQATRQSGTYVMACDGVVVFTSTLVISNRVEISAIGRDVTFDGEGKAQLFDILPSGSLTLRSIKLANGLHTGAGAVRINEAPGLTEAGDGEGGAVRNRGSFTAEDCQFINNKANGGPGNWWAWEMNLVERVGAARGGAIYSAGTLKLTRCDFTDNAAIGPAENFEGYGFIAGDALGGALYIADGTAQLAEVSFQRNRAVAGGYDQDNGRAAYGGAVAVVEGEVSLQGCVVNGSTVAGGNGRSRPGPAFGGGIFSSGNLTMDRTMVSSNNVQTPAWMRFGPDQPGEPARGGGLYIASGSVAKVNGSTFVFNTAAGGDSGNSTNLHVYSTVAAHGGGIYNAGTVGITNSTLGFNMSKGGDVAVTAFSRGCNDIIYGCFTNNPVLGNEHGGAIYAASNSVTIIVFSTIAHNILPQPADPTATNERKGGGIYNAGGEVTMQNAIVAENHAENLAGSATDRGHNLSSDSTLVTASTSMTADPVLRGLDFSLGAAAFFPLATTSPALNRGVSVADITSDQRGMNRQAGPAPDIGAVELAGYFLLDREGLKMNTSPGLAWRFYSSSDLKQWSQVAESTAAADGVITLSRGAGTLFYKAEQVLLP